MSREEKPRERREGGEGGEGAGNEPKRDRGRTKEPGKEHPEPRQEGEQGFKLPYNTHTALESSTQTPLLRMDRSHSQRRHC